MDTRDRKSNSEETNRKPAREISGPGAADFLTAPGGLDLPESDPAKGMGQTRGDGLITDARQVVPNLDPAGASAEQRWESEEAGTRRRQADAPDSEDRRDDQAGGSPGTTDKSRS